ncbi:MAG: hypothetical protein RL406_1731, partial [Pseudomonadota bacterium]
KGCNWLTLVNFCRICWLLLGRSGEWACGGLLMLEYQKSSAAPSPFTCECLFRHFALLVPLVMKLGDL